MTYETSEYRLKHIAEKLDYTSYLPINFIHVLESAIAGYMIYEDPLYHLEHCSESVVKLMEFIKFEELVRYVPAEGAIRFLQRYSNKLNLRTVEKSIACSGIKFDMEVEVQRNYSFDISSTLSADIIDVLDIPVNMDEVDNTLELSSEVCDILTFYSKLSTTEGVDLPEVYEDYVSLPSLSKITKIKKHHYVLPNFSYKLAKKQFEICDEVEVMHSYSEVDIFIDISTSVKSYLSDYYATYKAILLHYIPMFKKNTEAKINLHFFIGKITEVRIIDSYELLVEAVNTAPVIAAFGYIYTDSLFEHIGVNFKGKEIVMLTDDSIIINNKSIDKTRRVKFNMILLGDKPQALLSAFLAQSDCKVTYI